MRVSKGVLVLMKGQLVQNLYLIKVSTIKAELVNSFSKLDFGQKYQKQKRVSFAIGKSQFSPHGSSSSEDGVHNTRGCYLV